MFKLCEYQNLTIARFKEFGALLEENKDDEKRVLLLSKELPEDAESGDTIQDRDD